MDKELIKRESEFILYSSPDGQIKVEVFIHNESVWLTQKKMSELFGAEINTVNYPIKEIF